MPPRAAKIGPLAPEVALHERVAQDLKTAREALGHPVAKGDGSEAVWTTLFRKYLPQRYAVDKATIVDSKGQFSDQIDIVLFDRQVRH